MIGLLICSVALNLLAGSFAGVAGYACFGYCDVTGRASDAVEDNMGVASDEEMIAGTDFPLIILARRCVKSATLRLPNTSGVLRIGLGVGLSGLRNGFTLV